MEKLIVNTCIRLISPLGIEAKRSLLTWLSAHVWESNPANRLAGEQLLDELAGAWADTPNDFSDAVLAARTSSTKPIDLE